MRRVLPWALACILTGCSASSYSWQRYTARDLPAPVSSILTPMGEVIDAHHVLTYGTWTVGFANGKARAAFVCPPETTCYITIQNLKCLHPSGDSGLCRLNVFDDGSCNLFIPQRREAFEVQCPLELSLGMREAQEKPRPKQAMH
ncbi:MAG TPA: hypothetical protein VFS39_07615 [Nitrospira sp.]|nr:hypothetical protein [Nitrospira sp.]